MVLNVYAALNARGVPLTYQEGYDKSEKSVQYMVLIYSDVLKRQFPFMLMPGTIRMPFGMNGDPKWHAEFQLRHEGKEGEIIIPIAPPIMNLKQEWLQYAEEEDEQRRRMIWRERNPKFSYFEEVMSYKLEFNGRLDAEIQYDFYQTTKDFTYYLGHGLDKALANRLRSDWGDICISEKKDPHDVESGKYDIELADEDE